MNQKNILQKLGLPHHEYWPTWALNMITLPAWIWYGIRAKNLGFMTAINPAIKNGGLFGESKIELNYLLPNDYLPKTANIYLPTSLPRVLAELKNKNIYYPCIAKPEFGGRGRKVAVIHNEIDLQKYLREIDEDFMVQEKIEFEVELGLFFLKMPNEKNIRIPSVVLKEMMTVVGDGKKTVIELMQQQYRSALQIDRLLHNNPELLKEIPAKNQKKLLEPIGNHCNGTIFKDANYLVNEQLIKVFTEICNKIQGVYYGRFDLKVASIANLYEGKNILIMELNGINADAAHIFDPQVSLLQAVNTLAQLAKYGYKIAKNNIDNGAKTVSAATLFRLLTK